MSVTTQPPPIPAAADAAIPTVPIYRLTVAQYQAMADQGILTEDDPVELLEGWLVQKMTKHRPHSLVTLLIRQALERLLPVGWYVDSQEPIATTDSQPEPDVFVVRGEPRDFQDRQPGPEEVVLVIEVADTTLQTDRDAKQRVYARSGIPVYWIANLSESRFEVFADPSGPTEQPHYRQRREYGPGDEIPVMLAGTDAGSIPVQSLLP